MIKGYTTEQKQRHAYDMRENYQRILASFKATGYDEGKLEGKLEFVQAMKAKGYSVEQIAEITGLDLGGIKALYSKEPWLSASLVSGSVANLCSMEARLAMDENQVLVILADPGFKEALEVIKPNSEEQKRQRGFDMNRLTSDS